MTTYTLTELFDKRSELAGLILQAEKRARELRADLLHIEAAIRILRPGEELPAIVRKRIEFRSRFFKRGQLGRMCLDHMRRSEGIPVSINELLPIAIDGRELTVRDKEILRASIHTVMNKLSDRGVIERLPQVGRAVRWRLDAT